MKLYYFDFSARGETTRVMLRAAGKEFEDERISFADWPQFKPRSPSGQLPWMELDDGAVLSQSHAIEWYVAAECGFLPSGALEQARTLEIIELYEDAFNAIAPTFAIKDAEEKAKARSELVAPGGKAHARLAALDKLADKRPGDWTVADELTFADIFLFCALSFLGSGFLDGITKEAIGAFPALSALRSRVAAHPQVASQYGDVTSGHYLAFLP